MASAATALTTRGPAARGATLTEEAEHAARSYQDTEINIGQFRLDQEVKPNTVVDASVTISNGYQFISPLDPNYCETAVLRRVGLSITTILEVNGNEVDRASKCVPGGGLSADFALSWTTPAIDTERTFDVTVRAQFGATDEPAASQSTTVTVTPEAQEPRQECVSDADCPAGQTCVDGTCQDGGGGGLFGGPFLPCWADPNRSCATPEAVAWGLAVLLVGAVLIGGTT